MLSGHKFDIHAFHDTVLRCGPVPLRVLESIVHDYIEDVGPPQKEEETDDVTSSGVVDDEVSQDGENEGDARCEGEEEREEVADDCTMKAGGDSVVEKENGEGLSVWPYL